MISRAQAIDLLDSYKENHQALVDVVIQQTFMEREKWEEWCHITLEEAKATKGRGARKLVKLVEKREELAIREDELAKKVIGVAKAAASLPGRLLAAHDLLHYRRVPLAKVAAMLARTTDSVNELREQIIDHVAANYGQ